MEVFEMIAPAIASSPPGTHTTVKKSLISATGNSASSSRTPALEDLRLSDYPTLGHEEFVKISVVFF